MKLLERVRVIVGLVPSALRLGVVLIALSALSGCEVPRFQGPQIQSPPPGFLLVEDSYQQRRMFPDREVSLHTAWIRAGNGPYSGIYINAHPGVLTIDDVAAAREAGRSAAVHPETTFEEVEAMTIDDRTAWGWSEKLATVELGLDWVAYRTVVAYDTVSYAIEFYSGDPNLKSLAPDTLKAVIGSFEVGRTRLNLPLIAIIGGLMLLVVSVLRTRNKDRTQRHKSINLVQVKPEDDGEKEDDELTHAARSTAPPPPPPVSPTELREIRHSPEGG